MTQQHRIRLPDTIDLGELVVSMSNAITRSAQELSLPEKRLISACLAKSNRARFPNGYGGRQSDMEKNWHDWYDDKVFDEGLGPFTVRLSAEDYAETYNVGMSTAYNQLQAAAKKLMRRVIERPIISSEGSKGTREVHWVAQADYYEGEAYVQLTWSAAFVKHIYNLGHERTEYLLKQAAKFEAVYPWRLFELLKCHNDPARPYEPLVDEFARAMDAPPAYANDFAALRRRIIEVAIDELREKYGYDVSYSTTNAGRKVIGLKFKYDLNPPQKSLLALDGQGAK